jgi:hypothetical protein
MARILGDVDAETEDPGKDPYEERLELFKDAKSKKLAKMLVEAGLDVEGDAISQQNKDIAAKMGVSLNNVQAVRRVLRGQATIIGKKPEPQQQELGGEDIEEIVEGTPYTTSTPSPCSRSPRRLRRRR